MQGLRLEWDERNQGHIAGHGVSVEEVEEVTYQDGAATLFLRGRGAGRERRYYCLGRTCAGRFLFCVMAVHAARAVALRDRPRNDVRREAPVSRAEREDGRMKVPRFENEEQERTFWDEHGLEDIDDDELVEVALGSTRPAKLALPVHLDHRTAALLKRLARRRGIPPSSLVAMWIKQQVEKDAR